MSKRLIVVVTCVISLLSVLLIVGSVPHSEPRFGEQRRLPPTSPDCSGGNRKRPRCRCPTRLDRCNSTQFGGRPDRGRRSARSKARTGSRQPISSTQTPDAPTYNSTIRFVGSTLRPRDNDVDYTTNSNGSCVYVTAGDSNTVWNFPWRCRKAQKSNGCACTIVTRIARITLPAGSPSTICMVASSGNGRSIPPAARATTTPMF